MAIPTLSVQNISRPSSGKGSDSALHGRHVCDQPGEFVAADTGHRVTLAQAGKQAIGHHLQDAIADIMTKGVVDALEIVEIEKHNRQVAMTARLVLYRPIQAFA